MSVRIECPKKDALQAFARGQLSAPEAAQIQSHVDACQRCRTTLNAISPATQMFEQRDDSIASSPTLGIRGPVLATDLYPFLKPGVEADELGRLGNYRVLELLGKGGMGFVFRGEDIALRRPVAIKVMRPEMNRDSKGGERFIREARTLAKIKHDHLVTIYSADQDGDIIYFAMELLEGESLESWMRSHQSADLGEIIRIAREIASGLAVLHKRKLMHRDVKPANIWLEAPNRRVKILDLGLARPDGAASYAALTDSGIVLGTPDYMSPEQANGGEVDARTDLFSLGCILYRLCTGKAPFPGKTFPDVLMALANDTPTAPIKLNAELPPPLSKLIMQMLARNPKARPASAEAVVQALDEIEFDRVDTGDRTQPIKLTKPAKSKSSRCLKVIAVPWWRRPLVLVGIGIGALVGLALFMAVIVAIVILLIKPHAGPNAAAPPIAAAAQNKQFLVDMKEIARQNWPFQMPKEPKDDDGKRKFKDAKGPPKDFDQTVLINGERKQKSIFMHPPVPPLDDEPASLTYRLDRQFDVFESDVSLNDRQESENPVTFTVYGDGKLLWESRPISSPRDIQHCVVSIRGVSELKIETRCAGPPKGAHAVWIEPVVAK